MLYLRRNSAESVSDEEDETLDCTLTELEPTTPTSETDARKNTQPLKSTASKGEVSTVESQKSKKPPVPPIGSHVKAGGRKRVSAEVEGSQLNMPFSAVSCESQIYPKNIPTRDQSLVEESILIHRR